MKSFLKWMACALGGAVLVHVAVIFSMPKFIMGGLWEGAVKGEKAAVNRFLAADKASAENRRVVRPSPDLLHSTCLVDLSSGPVMLEGEWLAGYWSLQLYDMRASNFASMTNLEGRGSAAQLKSPGTFKVALVPTPAGRAELESQGYRVFEVAGERAIALVRWSALDAEQENAALAAQQGARCYPG
ncbi:DUF1254 domain-containing protein [Biformimicrobium ophioploci]|uniref:DUF1254 domain-containing protein n=1 Tax=Biformimicrobium ophioploci TaxID=3036711 RepID=A0ABQ6LZ94_9GAMM|nr:DUF1254 domain-containing protein [Microbulbifer sp. NKW57]GMG87405.1 hypothetical protein MNKW57_17260 [Microbulbifer sp. NKW57]